MEHRQEERYPAQLPLAYGGDLIDGRGTVVNLSRSGCGVRITKKVRVGAYLHLLLSLPQKGVRLKIELAAVRWANGALFGLEFIRMSRDHHTRLQEYVDTLRIGTRSASMGWVG